MTRPDPTLTSRMGRRSPSLITTVGICALSVLAPGWPALAGADLPLTAPSAFDQAAPSAAPIPVTPLTGVGSLDATVTITADGTVDGKATQGDLTAVLTTNDQGSSRIDVTGSLLDDVVGRVGGAALKIFRPSRVSLFAVPEGDYAVVSSLFDVCVAPEDGTTADALDQLSPQRLMTILTSGDVARGTFLGDETLNGMAVKHYLIDGTAFLAAAQASTDPDVSAFARALRSASDADLFIAADTGYPVAYRGAFSGSFEALGFDGDLTVAAELTGVGANTPVSLPGTCDHPISR